MRAEVVGHLRCDLAVAGQVGLALLLLAAHVEIAQHGAEQDRGDLFALILGFQSQGLLQVGLGLAQEEEVLVAVDLLELVGLGQVGLGQVRIAFGIRGIGLGGQIEELDGHLVVLVPGVVHALVVDVPPVLLDVQLGHFLAVGLQLRGLLEVLVGLAVLL